MPCRKDGLAPYSMQQPWRHCSETSTHSRISSPVMSILIAAPVSDPNAPSRRVLTENASCGSSYSSWRLARSMQSSRWFQLDGRRSRYSGHSGSASPRVSPPCLHRGGQEGRGVDLRAALHRGTVAIESSKPKAHADRVARDIESGGGGLSEPQRRRGARGPRTVRKWKFRVSASAQKRRRNR